MYNFIENKDIKNNTKQNININIPFQQIMWTTVDMGI